MWMVNRSFSDQDSDEAQIWFDGGYSAEQQKTYIDLLAKLQPKAAIFNACDVTSGDCLTENSGKFISTLPSFSEHV
jgi:hypothetical protein